MDCDGFEYLASVHEAYQQLSGSDVLGLREALCGLETLCADHALVPLLKQKLERLQTTASVGQVREPGVVWPVAWPVAWSVNPPTFVHH